MMGPSSQSLPPSMKQKDAQVTVDSDGIWHNCYHCDDNLNAVAGDRWQVMTVRMNQIA